MATDAATPARSWAITSRPASSIRIDVRRLANRGAGKYAQGADGLKSRPISCCCQPRESGRLNVGVWTTVFTRSVKAV
jgi:hypothetical protein